MRRSTLAVSLLALAFWAGYATAQTTPPPDSLKVDYFTNAHTPGAPDATVHLTNPGTTGGSVCAAIFVFDNEEEMQECCSCLLSTNDLRTLSVNTDLTSNPLLGRFLQTGVISIVSTTPVEGSCQIPTSLNPTSGGVRAWATHIDHFQVGPLVAFTESSAPSQDATLSNFEENQLSEICFFLVLQFGGARGVCSCGTGS